MTHIGWHGDAETAAIATWIKPTESANIMDCEAKIGREGEKKHLLGSFELEYIGWTICSVNLATLLLVST